MNSSNNDLNGSRRFVGRFSVGRDWQHRTAAGKSAGLPFVT